MNLEALALCPLPLVHKVVADGVAEEASAALERLVAAQVHRHAAPRRAGQPGQALGALDEAAEVSPELRMEDEGAGLHLPALEPLGQQVGAEHEAPPGSDRLREPDDGRLRLGAAFHGNRWNVEFVEVLWIEAVRRQL
jgi:hypothetical protein